MPGTVLLLNNMGVIEIKIGEIVGTHWPLLLVFWGVNTFVEKNRRRGNLLSGGIPLVAGYL